MLRGNFKFYLWVVLGTLLLVISFSWLKGILAGEQGRVHKFVLKGKSAVESKNLLACSDIISFSYHDEYGNDRAILLGVTKEFFAYYKKIIINIESIDIKLNDTKTQADVEIVALIIGQNHEDIEERVFEGEKGRFMIKLIKEENKWKLSEIVLYEPMTIMGQTIS